MRKGQYSVPKIPYHIHNGIDSPNLPPTPKSYGVFSYAMNTASGTQKIYHGLGKMPSIIRINAIFGGGATNSAAFSYGLSNGTTSSCVAWEYLSGTASTAASSKTYAIILLVNGAGQEATVTADSNNITLTWTEVSSGLSGNAQIIWEADV